MTAVEEQIVTRASTRDAVGRLSEEFPFNEEKNRHEEWECEHVLEINTQSIGFSRSVGRELDTGISFQRDYCIRNYSAVFQSEHDGQLTALQCKFNVYRDFDKTAASARTVWKKLSCSQIFIVVPFTPGTLDGFLSHQIPSGGQRR